MSNILIASLLIVVRKILFDDGVVWLWEHSTTDGVTLSVVNDLSIESTNIHHGKFVGQIIPALVNPINTIYGRPMIIRDIIYNEMQYPHGYIVVVNDDNNCDGGTYGQYTCSTNMKPSVEVIAYLIEHELNMDFTCDSDDMEYIICSGLGINYLIIGDSVLKDLKNKNKNIYNDLFF